MSNYIFGGIGYVEAQDRYDELRTGVPALGNMQVLATAPAVGEKPRGRGVTSSVFVHNSGGESAHVRLRHGESQKTRTAEWLTALLAAGNRVVGNLQWKNVVAGTVVISEAGALLNIVDDGNGVLHDIGIPANVRGSINYVTGLIDFTWGGAPTEPQQITYDFTDYTDFASPTQNHTVAVGGAFPETFQLPFGRVNPGSLSFNTNGAAWTFIDDGKGNIVETTAAAEAVRGTIDYATGLITVNSAGGGVLAGNFVGTFTFNPFAALIVAAGACKILDLFSMIPELTGAAWGAAFTADTMVALVGETTSTHSTDLITRWSHFGEDPYRVEGVYSAFAPGGASNA